LNVLSKSDLRLQFFDLIFGDANGYACIATSNPVSPKSSFEERYFVWPSQSTRMENYILEVEKTRNVYFCINLLDKPRRRKGNCLFSEVLWADLDEVDPTQLKIPPQIVIRSSANRYQAIWRLSTKLDAELSEQYSKRIAYAFGADKSGWDLTQLLRVPLTRNFKYNPPQDIEVMIAATEAKCVPLLFEGLPRVEDPDEVNQEREVPQDLPSVEEVLIFKANKLPQVFFSLYTTEPEKDEDWSGVLWRLINVCLEADLSLEETFVLAGGAKCNKYARDKRPPSHLWREVVKAASQHEQFRIYSPRFKPLQFPVIFDPDKTIVEDTFVDRYRAWGVEATDAIEQFHDLSAMILLSTIVANSVKLMTSYGPMVPNLWGMILGDSTLSRKTTAMRMVTDIIAGIDPELVLATDGTAEGLLTGLETRPHKTSIFYKDELSGFFESINRREFLAGMPETLTALYDVPPIYTRRLRKEVIRIESPIFIFFGGGVRDRVYETVHEEYIISGFLPRFLVVSGDTDYDRLRRTGPPTEEGSARRISLVEEASDLFENYAAQVQQRIGGQLMQVPLRINAQLTQKAWDEYGAIEEALVNAASASSIPNLALPTLERLSRSILKMATIFAAIRQVPKDNGITVEEIDVRTAARYGQEWGMHSIELILNAGKRVGEKTLDKIEKTIQENPGILRSTIMTRFKLNKREADEFLSTLEERALVRKEKQGRGWSYWAA
jgi:ribosomal protein S25